MNNDNNELRTLLDRFYGGEATEAEERQMRELLETTTGEEFEADKRIIAGLEQSVPVPDGLEDRLSRAIDGWEAAEKMAERKRRMMPKAPMWWRVAGIAASVAIMVGVGMTMNRGQHGGTGEPADTFSDPQEACAATEKALTIFAKALNKSMDGVEFAEQVSDKAMSAAMGM